MATDLLGPVSYVNGFACRNCTDTDYAIKHVDPARPKDGPYGINAGLYPSDKPPASAAGVVAPGALNASNAVRHSINAMA